MDNDKNLQAINFQIVKSSHEENEVSLYDLWCNLIRYKYIYIVLISLFTISAFIYSRQLPSVYQSTAYLLPPYERDIVDLNLNNGELDSEPYTTAQVYEEYIKSFNSRAVRYAYFEKAGLIGFLVKENSSKVDKNEVFDKKFHQLLSLERSKDKFNPDPVVTRLSSNSPERSAKWLNEYISFADEFTIDSLKRNLRKKIVKRKAELTEKIIALRQTALKRKKDSKIILSEAINTAEKLGIKKNITVRNNQNLQTENATNTGQSLSLEDLYIKGTEVLRVELDAIESRKDLDSYIIGLRDYEEEISLLDAGLRKLENDSKVRTVTVDQLAAIPKNRSKPNRAIIIVSGFVIGLIISIFVSVVLNIVAVNRKPAA